MQRFLLGQVVATPGALEAFEHAEQTPDEFLRRHASGDWGDVGPLDAKKNESSLRDGQRLLSAYNLTSGERIWIITEADWSVTTILLPDEG